jgi:hypothetical protein
MAQQPDQQSTPTKKKNKEGAEQTSAAQGQPGANATQPQEKPAKQRGAMKERGPTNQAGATNEPGAGKGRKGQKGQANQEAATTPGANVSGQAATTPTNEPATGKGRKGRAKTETAAQTGTDVSGQPPGSASPGATQQEGQGKKGMKGRAAKTAATPATTGVSATPAAASATAAPSASIAGQQNALANTGAAGAKAKKPDPQQVQQIRAQHANFRAQPKPQQVPAVAFNQNYRIQGSDRWQGPQYEVFRSYHPERHDQGWYRSRYSRVEQIGGGYYYWNNGYWYPAWGYSPSAEYYPYDGPIYVGRRAEPPDQVIADVQAELQQMGYYRGEVDGLLGPLTREALAGYQADQGLTQTAAIDQPTLDSLEMG